MHDKAARPVVRSSCLARGCRWHVSLSDGLYDSLITESLARALAEQTNESDQTLEHLSSADAAIRLSDALSRQLSRALEDLPGSNSETLKQQVELINALLAQIRIQGRASEMTDAVVEPPQILRGIHRLQNPTTGPETGLGEPWLFTAGKDSPSLLSELLREIESCDQIDVLVSFITLAGVRKMLDILRTATATDAHGEQRTRIRVLTTTYTGATEQAAVDLLSELPGCEVKISLDGRRSRLHAKAWIFHRRTGFGSAYVGSSNLSGAALLGGLEWTVKFTQRGDEAMFLRAQTHFETLWNDDEFQHYDRTNQNHRAKLKQALVRESGEVIIAQSTFFDIQPKVYQQEMLDQLQIERQQGRHRNLVVAATGTGKTVVAAFDYRDESLGKGRPRLLFVAHRQEILTQSLRTYREVLRDYAFGDVLGGGNEPDSFEHLFATIDSVDIKGLVERFGPGYWDTVVIDECHRMAGSRFHKLASTIKPRIVLGLTATPERADGQSILPYFTNRPDGSPAVELRLWSALDLQLLAPFEYYGIDDETDFSEVPWGRADEETRIIDRLVTGNQARARQVVHEWERLAGSARNSRAVLFCVSIAHAEFMTRQLEQAGIPALCLTGETPRDERRRAPSRLRNGEVSALVTVDLFNEGIDLPEVDTLLLLRPTQSPVVFQQQIGRGLRLAPGKESCLILDFVGRHRAEFRFDRLFTTLTGQTRRELEQSVREGFSRLPAGCHFQLGRLTREQVLRNLQTLTQHNWTRLRTELQAYAALGQPVRLASFVSEQSIDIEDMYRDNAISGWTALKRAAGLATAGKGPEDEYLGRRFGGLLHVDDPEQIQLIRRVSESAGEYMISDPQDRARLQMLAYQVDGTNDRIGTGEAFLERLGVSPALRSELGELGEVLESRARLLHRPIPNAEDTVLCLHARYSRREILTAFGWYTADKRPPSQAGVLALVNRKTELLFVTLDKSSGFHDRIAYRDHAISPERFHWQTQNSAGSSTVAGRRYVESPGNGWSFQLFVRSHPDDVYYTLGSATIESWDGEKPMSIVWKLTQPLSPRLFEEFSVLRGS
jgi:superfamily II DNA or RNA helicase